MSARKTSNEMKPATMPERKDIMEKSEIITTSMVFLPILFDANPSSGPDSAHVSPSTDMIRPSSVLFSPRSSEMNGNRNAIASRSKNTKPTAQNSIAKTAFSYPDFFRIVVTPYTPLVVHKAWPRGYPPMARGGYPRPRYVFLLLDAPHLRIGLSTDASAARASVRPRRDTAGLVHVGGVVGAPVVRVPMDLAVNEDRLALGLDREGLLETAGEVLFLLDGD